MATVVAGKSRELNSPSDNITMWTVENVPKAKFSKLPVSRLLYLKFELCNSSLVASYNWMSFGESSIVVFCRRNRLKTVNLHYFPFSLSRFIAGKNPLPASARSLTVCAFRQLGETTTGSNPPGVTRFAQL